MMTQTIPTKQRLSSFGKRRNNARAAVGFASPASDLVERHLDLNVLLIKHPAATFFVRVSGDSMKDAGINAGDILIVDRAKHPIDGQIVIAALNGELIVRRLKKNTRGTWLVAEIPGLRPIEITEDSHFEVWGTVTSIVHRV